MAVATLVASANAEFAMDVREGLSREGQKTLPSKYLYDALGSSLFESICLLPEYGLTRAEAGILERHADAIVARLPEKLTVAELGSGTGKKTRILLEAIRRRAERRSPFNGHTTNGHTTNGHTTYHPIEISPAALERCESELRTVPGLRIVGVRQEYLEGLREVAGQRGPGEPLLVLFLGSSIGNFDNEEGVKFLSQVRSVLRAGDALLLAVDLVKPEETLLVAYDDPTGVTSAFDLNLLSRINRELGGHFDLQKFEHQALYNPETRSIEMHLRSLVDQNVCIEQLDMSFTIRRGETIWTETSHKYSLPELDDIARKTKFRAVGRWMDTNWGFAENLWMAG